MANRPHVTFSNELDWLFNFSENLLCVIGFDGQFKRLNPAWEKVLGFNTQELSEQSVVDLVHPEDRATLNWTFQDVLSGKGQASFKERFRSKDGRYHWLQCPRLGRKAIELAMNGDTMATKARTGDTA